MQTYHFEDQIVSDEGAVTLTGLPPLTRVAIMVIDPEPCDWQEIMRQWIAEMRQHPFAKMSREKISERLRQSREKVYEEDYGHRHTN